LPETLEKMERFLPENVYTSLFEIIKKKKNQQEKDIIENIIQIDSYIESELKNSEDVESFKHPQTDSELNNFIFKTFSKL